MLVWGQSSTVVDYIPDTNNPHIASANVTLIIHVPEKLEMTVNHDNKAPEVTFTSNIVGKSLTQQNGDLIVAVP